MVYIADNTFEEYHKSESPATRGSGWKNMSRYTRIWDRETKKFLEAGKPIDTIVSNIWDEIKRAAVECSHVMVAIDKATKEMYMKIERTTTFSWTMNKRISNSLLVRDFAEHVLYLEMDFKQFIVNWKDRHIRQPSNPKNWVLSSILPESERECDELVKLLAATQYKKTSIDNRPFGEKIRITFNFKGFPQLPRTWINEDRTIIMEGLPIPAEAIDTIWMDKASDSWGKDQQWIMPKIQSKQKLAPWYIKQTPQ